MSTRIGTTLFSRLATTSEATDAFSAQREDVKMSARVLGELASDKR